MGSFKILAVSPSFLPGVSRVLKELSAVGLADFMYLENFDLTIAEKYDVCIVGGWLPTYPVIIPRIQTRVWILWTSPLLQSELTGGVEWNFLHELLTNDRVERVWFGDKGLERVFPEKGFYMSYPYAHPGKTFPEPSPKEGIGLMTALSNPQKNILVQLAAVKLVQQSFPEAVLHMNGLPLNHQEFADHIGLKYVNHGWLETQEYRALIKRLKVQTHVFVSESFSYATMESILLGTPCTVSPCVYENLDSGRVVENIDSPMQIAAALTSILNLREDEYRECCREQWIRALKRAEDNNCLIEQTIRMYSGDKV